MNLDHRAAAGAARPVRNKARAMLTTLGVVIGVGSVIAMLGIGSGAQRASPSSWPAWAATTWWCVPAR